MRVLTAMNLSALKDVVQILAFIAGAWSAVQAYRTYRINSRLEEARWTVRMYEKFFEHDALKRIRDILDCKAKEAPEVSALVDAESAELTDYLNFFELLAILQESKQLSGSAIEKMFGYYLDCLRRNAKLMAYISNGQNGFERLNAFLQNRAAA